MNQSIGIHLENGIVDENNNAEIGFHKTRKTIFRVFDLQSYQKYWPN